MSIVLPNLIVGPIVVVVGIVVFLFRRQLRDMFLNAEKTVFGEKAARTMGQLQTPFWVGAVGILSAGMGVVTIVGAIVRLIALNT
jgi:hypothetical protein